MYYFLKKEGFNLTDKTIKLELSSSLSKKEKLFFHSCLESFEKIDEEYVKISLVSIFSLLKIKKIEDFEKFLSKFQKKTITYSIEDREVIISKGITHFFNFVSFEADSFIYSLSNEIRLSYKKNNLFNRINLHEILKFEFSLSKSFYLILLKEQNVEGSLKFSLKAFKDLLDIKEDNYSRFYDLEKNILHKIIADINNYSSYYINYEKIKSGTSRSNRVTHLNINYINKYHFGLKEKTNLIMKQISDKITDFNFTFKLLKKHLNTKAFDDVLEESLSSYKLADSSNLEMTLEKNLNKLA